MVKNHMRPSLKKGFTLIELTLSIGLLGLALTLTGGVLISVVKKFQKQAALQEVERNGDYVLRVMEDNIRKSNSVSTDPNGYLITQIPDLTTGTVTTRYFGYVPNTTCAGNFIFMTTGDISRRMQNGSKLTKDSANGIRVTAFQTQIYPGDPSQVFVRMSLQSCLDSNIVKTYQTFITARGTYQ